MILGAFVLSFISIAAFQMARAGSLSPSAAPGGTMYTLNDIYTRLTTNATATEGDHNLLSALSPAATMHTLKEVYEAIPTIVAGTVKTGTSYLGIAGTLYGDTDQSKVLTTASGAGTYNAANLTAGNIKSGTSYGVSSTGTLTPDGGTSAAADLFNGKTANLTNDWNLDTGTLNLACNTSTFDGTGNRVPNAYDDGGDGSNRWCVTDSGNAVAGDILSGKTAWVDGLEITGTGTALTSLFDGGNTAGGVDDYNNAGEPATGRYAGGWTQCAVENNHCGTGSPSADARDDSTGLVWTFPCNGVGCTSFSDTDPMMYSWDSSATNNNGKTASDLCSTAGYLPHQKQLMQTYIDGSYKNLEASGVYRSYWSATTVSNTTASAWGTSLSNGYTYDNTKTYSTYVRCVLLSPGN